MGEAVTSYTGTDAIRAAIGVSDNDIPDKLLVDQRLDLELTVDLDLWVPTHATLYAAGIATGAAAEDRLKANYISLYAQWFCAAQVASNMKLALPQSISDGKAEMRRFQTLDLAAIEIAAKSRVTYYKNLLSAAEGSTSTATPISFTSISSPVYDPVLGA